MLKTKIDWADSTWNPITGCCHGCRYCYARGIANRFDGHAADPIPVITEGTQLHDLDTPVLDASGKKMAYPYGFDPTFHRYRLQQMSKRQSRSIFVGSMADIFGAWVPDSWIETVFDACLAAPQHKYLFLTKNPARYLELAKNGRLPDSICMWYGYTATRQKDLWTFNHADECPCRHLFVSMEPILEQIQPGFSSHTPADWVIIGAETGLSVQKVVPKKEWVQQITDECLHAGIPVFHKGSLQEIMGGDFIQQVPWE